MPVELELQMPDESDLNILLHFTVDNAFGKVSASSRSSPTLALKHQKLSIEPIKYATMNRGSTRML
jgi:hypothetical protein